METSVSASELIEEVEALVMSHCKAGQTRTKQGRKDTVAIAKLMLEQTAKPARLSRQVLFGRLDDVQTFLGYLVYWAPGLVIFEPAPEYIDYFGIVRAEKVAGNTIDEIHIDSLFDEPDRSHSHKILIKFRYDGYGTYADIFPTIGGVNMGGHRMFPQHAYTMLNWLTIMLGLNL